MMKMESKLVKWRDGFQCAVDASIAHAELERIRKKHAGDLTARVVVDEAAKKRNPLYRAFEWNDKVAADKLRCEQARYIMRGLVIVREEYPSAPTRVYEISRDEQAPRGEQKTVYRSLEDIMADPDARARLLQQTLRDLLAMRCKFSAMQELAIVWRSVDELVSTMAVS